MSLKEWMVKIISQEEISTGVDPLPQTRELNRKNVFTLYLSNSISLVNQNGEI